MTSASPTPHLVESEVSPLGDSRVRVAGSDREFRCGTDDTLLRAALRAGMGFPYECNVGSCGNCRFELTDGEVEMLWPEAPGLNERDRARNRYLGCQAQPRGDCTIKLRLDPRYVPPHTPMRTQAALVATRPITGDISEFRFELEAPHGFEPGQYALLSLPSVQGARAYSMSNVAGDGRVWEFQIRRVREGRGTAALFDQLKVGDRIGIDGPYGMAWLRRDTGRDILCLAGGSGLAPMVSITRGAAAELESEGRHLHFVYGGRTPADICGAEMLSVLPGWDEHIHYHAAISQPGDGEWSGLVGFVHDVAQQLFAERLADMDIYFAGPPPMIEAVQRVLFEAKVPPDQQHFDKFL